MNTKYRYFRELDSPTREQIFVFGCNYAGRHGKGAAAYAMKYKGAIYGKKQGIQGKSYGIPTKDFKLRVLSLREIQTHVDTFVDFAKVNPSLEFFVTQVGCGLAGYKSSEIAPFFRGAPINCVFDENWKEWLEGV